MPNPQLDAALTDLLDADFAFSPVTASGYGLTDYDDRLDDVSADAQRARDAAAVEFLTALDAIGDEGLDDRRDDRPRPRPGRPARAARSWPRSRPGAAIR